MNRIEIINLLISKKGYQDYLEIGLREPSHCYDHIQAPLKASVDPGLETSNNQARYPFTSDLFFELLEKGVLDKNSEHKWDLIFIDGLHTADQVERDINNFLRHLTPQGCLVVHDSNPPSEHHARSNFYDHSTPAQAGWNGSVWKAIYKIRATRPDLEVHTVDCDWGCCIIRRGEQELCAFDNPYYDYDKFDRNRKLHLNLISEAEFLERLQVM